MCKLCYNVVCHGLPGKCAHDKNIHVIKTKGGEDATWSAHERDYNDIVLWKT